MINVIKCEVTQRFGPQLTAGQQSTLRAETTFFVPDIYCRRDSHTRRRCIDNFTSCRNDTTNGLKMELHKYQKTLVHSHWNQQAKDWSSWRKKPGSLRVNAAKKTTSFWFFTSAKLFFKSNSTNEFNPVKVYETENWFKFQQLICFYF